jgi:putative transcriptional regulator
MQRLRLKADGRIVELRDGQEFPLAPAMPPRLRSSPLPAMPIASPTTPDARRAAGGARPAPPRAPDAARIRARLGVPVETIRNWEQGKRAPRGPARALLAVIAHSPETVFAALATGTVAGLSVMVDVSLRDPECIPSGPRENAICWHGCFRSP